MAKPRVRRSAGLLMWRRRRGHIEALLGHPGGPYFTHKDNGVWSIPKGEYDPGEEPLDAAKREFEEETGFAAEGDFQLLGETRLKSGKVITAWAFEGDVDAANLHSNDFEMEWPPRSGKRQCFPEIDRCEWLSLPAARQKIHPAQVRFLNLLEQQLNSDHERNHRSHPRGGQENRAAGPPDTRADVEELRPRSGPPGGLQV